MSASPASPAHIARVKQPSFQLGCFAGLRKQPSVGTLVLGLTAMGFAVLQEASHVFPKQPSSGSTGCCVFRLKLLTCVWGLACLGVCVGQWCVELCLFCDRRDKPTKNVQPADSPTTLPLSRPLTLAAGRKARAARNNLRSNGRSKLNNSNKRSQWKGRGRGGREAQVRTSKY